MAAMSQVSESLAVRSVRAYYDKARQPKFHPSELRLSEVSDCQRKQVLRILGYQRTHELPVESLRNMETGNIWERWLIERLQESGAMVATQVTVHTPYGATGHIDVKAAEDGAPILHEVKAVSRWAKVLPDPKHVSQVMAYLHFYGRHHGITRAEIDYLHRDNGAGPFTYAVEYDPAEGEAIEASIKTLRGLVDAKTVPAIPEEMTPRAFPCWYESKQDKYECYCPFWGHCWAAKEEA